MGWCSEKIVDSFGSKSMKSRPVENQYQKCVDNLTENKIIVKARVCAIPQLDWPRGRAFFHVS